MGRRLVGHISWVRSHALWFFPTGISLWHLCLRFTCSSWPPRPLALPACEKPEPASPGPGFADWRFRLATLLRLGPLIPYIVLDSSGARLLHFLGGDLLVVLSLTPASPGCLVQLVPGIVLNTSLGHILLPPFLFLGLHRNKKPPSHSGRSFHQNKTQFSSTPQVYHAEGRSPAGPRPDCLNLDFL